jgi:hypothetical protein
MSSGEVVRADPALRRTVLVLVAGIFVAGVLVIAALPQLLAALGPLSQRSRGEAVLFLVAFITPFAVLACTGGFHAISVSARALREGRFPPHGMRVLRDSPVVTGPVVRVLAVLGLTLGTSLLLAATMLVVLTYRTGTVLWYGCPRG